MSNQSILPMGVLVFCHSDASGLVERVPYMTEESLCKAFSEAIDGGFPAKNIWTYVRHDRANVADKLLDIMQEKVGERYPVLQLNHANLNVVLGTYTVTIPASTQ